MTARIIDGRAIAQALKDEVRAAVEVLLARGGRRPGLAVVMVGDNPASAIYVRNKRRACEETGIVSVDHDLPQSTTETELCALIDRLNRDGSIDGILVQLPLPEHIRPTAILERIEALARQEGLSRVVLETGSNFDAAKRVYERGGFETCEPILDYPPSAWTAFYAKSLSA